MFKDRWKRARTDTSGFAKWKRNSVLALSVAFFQYLLKQLIGSRPEEAVNDLLVTLFTLILVFFMLPTFEFAWNYLRAPHKIFEEKVEELNRIILSQQKQLEEKESRVTPEQWRDLANRFKEIDPNISAHWHEDRTGSESWRISGGDASPRKNSELLCEMAGAMLMRSSILATLSNQARSQDNDVFRWLFFLKETSGLDRIQYGEEYNSSEPEKKFLVYFGSINNLTSVSALACIKCEKHEVKQRR